MVRLITHYKVMLSTLHAVLASVMVKLQTLPTVGTLRCTKVKAVKVLLVLNVKTRNLV